MERLTFEGNFCDIAMCAEVRGGSFCEDGYCSQRKVWERLKRYEDLEEQGRLVELETTPRDSYEGLKRKYFVFKSDTGELVENCFILRPDRDETAKEALRAYARSTDNKQLAHDIFCWVGPLEEAEAAIAARGKEG